MKALEGLTERIIFWVLLLSACEAASQAGEGWEGSTQPPRENPTNRGVHLGLSPDTHHGRQAEEYWRLPPPRVPVLLGAVSAWSPPCWAGCWEEEALFKHRHYSHWGHWLVFFFSFSFSVFCQDFFYNLYMAFWFGFSVFHQSQLGSECVEPLGLPCQGWASCLSCSTLKSPD